MPGRDVDPRFPQRMRELLDASGLSYRALADITYHGKTYLHDLAHGRKTPTIEVARRIDNALRACGELATMVLPASPAMHEVDVHELARRVAASDVSAETLEHLELAVDDLAVAYASRAARDLVPEINEHLAYVVRLLDVRTTLTQQRRLIVAGGWLALMAATVHIDLQTRALPGAYLETARQLAEHAEQPELAAWVLETRAWDALTNRDYRGAVDLSRQAQHAAPAGSSALIQATAQEGRAWARMGNSAETRDALGRVEALVSPLKVPYRPEHHYRYDPGKALAYTATTLSWVGDPVAEVYAREVVVQLEAAAGRPRRTALARLDLALALVSAGKADEAAVMATEAIAAGLFVASNWWRSTEVMSAVDRAGPPEAAALRDAYETYRPAGK